MNDIYNNFNLEDIYGEIWKDIPRFENYYQASNFGRIKSLKREIFWHKDKKKRPIRERILHCYLNGMGYRTVTLWKDGISKIYKVHRLIGFAFIPNLNNLPEINHKDLNRENNNVNNIEWCSPSYNLKHSYDNSDRVSKIRGINARDCKLTEKQVLEIRKIRKLTNLSYKKIGDSFGLSWHSIWKIVNRKTWKHI